jgi:O-antigen ligase
MVWLAAVLPLLFISKSTKSVTPIGIALAFFALWIAATNQWVSASYTAAAPYHAAFLATGFLLARSVDLRTLYGSALAGAVMLSAWALWQALGGARGQALFETPATLAAVLNLVLLPGLVWVAFQKNDRFIVPMLAALVVGLLCAQSRGGWLGFGAGALAALVLARRAGFSVRPAILWTLSTLMAGGLALCVHSMGSVEARLGLYEVALRSMASPLWGTGYLSFYYHLEPLKAQIPDYAAGFTYFVHNDYLQTLLELGVPGLVALLTLVVLPLVRHEKDVKSIAAIAAIVATAVHALVDFPFYVPICLLLFGAALGVVDSSLPRNELRIHKISKTIVAALCIWVLATPVVAETAARYAQRQWRAQENESAAYWFEFARRVTPRDWRYHWYAGQFWQAVAAGNNNRRAAQLAQNAFADGRAANPRELRLSGSRQ